MINFKEIYEKYLRKPPKKSQHVTGWIWKQSDCDQNSPQTVNYLNLSAELEVATTANHIRPQIFKLASNIIN